MLLVIPMMFSMAVCMDQAARDMTMEEIQGKEN